MTQQVLLIHLGPVQDFIAAARRCQDLWFGSWMLSDLARAVAMKLAERGATLVFPAQLHEDVAVANKILVVVDGVDPGEEAEAGRSAMQIRLRQLAGAAFADLRPRGTWDAAVRGDVALQQLDELMEYFWVAVPAGGGYAEARERAEHLLECRKRTHTWGPVTTGHERVPKSSIDGLRESVFKEEMKRVSPERRRRRFGVRGGEQLCGVGLLKRLGCELLTARPDGDELLRNGRPVFHSTSHVTAGPLLARVARRGAAGREAVERYVDALRKEHRVPVEERFRIASGELREAALVRHPWDEDAAPPSPARVLRYGGKGYDGVLLFENRLDDVIEQCAELPDEEQLVGARVREIRTRVAPALRACLGELGVKPGPGRPTPYYAMLRADGDHMGHAIGELAGAAGDATGLAPLARHQRLGEHLHGFARQCGELIEAHGGSLIYAGGDDVLALVPLHTVLQCARALRERFAEAMRGSGLFTAGTPTLSVGVAIAHHLAPLEGVRAMADSAEKLAKIEGGRDALAILADKRSGGALQAVGKWDDGDPIDRRLARWGKALAKGELPDGVAWALEEAMRPFAAGGEAVDAGVIARLVERVLARRRGPGQERLGADVRALLDASFATHGATVGGVARMSEEIQLARVFLAAWDDAWEVCS